MKLMIMVGLLGLAGVAAGCSNSDTANTNTNANTTVATTTTTNTTVAQQTSPAPGDSEVATTTDSSGVRTDTRTFKNNTRVSKVVVTTTREGKRTAKVYPVTGEPRDLPEDKVANALNDTGDAIADAAGFVVDKTKD